MIIFSLFFWGGGGGVGGGEGVYIFFMSTSL